jgi:hypothetical protein
MLRKTKKEIEAEQELFFLLMGRDPQFGEELEIFLALDSQKARDEPPKAVDGS